LHRRRRFGVQRGGQFVHVGGKLPAAKSGDAPAAPEPFARCEVRNYGRLPVLDIRLPIAASFSSKNAPAKTVQANVDIPGLASDAAYEFSMLNGTASDMTYKFDRAISVTRVDRRAQSQATLFADRHLADMEAHAVHGTLAASTGPASPLTIVFKGFKFKPNVLHVKTGQTVTFVNGDDEAHSIISADKSLVSGAIDGRGQWRYTFAKAGRYLLHCDYHPYMQASIVVD